jgi:hypothetical protein
MFIVSCFRLPRTAQAMRCHGHTVVTCTVQKPSEISAISGIHSLLSEGQQEGQCALEAEKTKTSLSSASKNLASSCPADKRRLSLLSEDRPIVLTIVQ